MDSKLPYKKTIIKHSDFSKDKRTENLMGKVNFNKEKGKYEIAIDKRLTPELKKLTEVHELVHARRGHGASVTPREENEVEIEAVARTPKTCLTQAESILHDYLIFNPKNPDKPLSPNDPDDLKIILRRIKKIVVK
jgi:hypothetical protein